jgi:hypothetical protein
MIETDNLTPLPLVVLPVLPPAKVLLLPLDNDVALKKQRKLSHLGSERCRVGFRCRNERGSLVAAATPNASVTVPPLKAASVFTSCSRTP